MDNTEFNRLKLLLEPCQSAEDLDNYIRVFFNLELPWDIVDEESTSSSLKFLWSAYSFLLTGKGNSKHIVAASRNSGKTLIASLFQYFSMLHFRRHGVHVSAILSQSAALIDYIDNYLRLPELAPFKNTDNYRKKMLIGLPPNDASSCSDAILRVVTASKKGANSQRASTLSYDEVELIPPEILTESAFIADPSRDGICRSPIYLYLSSRKTAQGNFQQLMDSALGERAKEKRVFLHKWSQVDWLQKCNDITSLESQGIEKAFLNTETLDVVWGRDLFELSVPEGGRNLYRECDAYKGCVKCPAFLACLGRAVRQRGDSRLLRDVLFVGDVLDNAHEPSAIISQTLNWKPDTQSLVFKSFSWGHHVGDFNRFYEFVSGGESFNPTKLTEEEVDDLLQNGTKQDILLLTPTKEDIYKKMREVGWRLHYGVDWGYSPAPAVVVVTGYHMKWKRACVLHVDGAKWHSNTDWAAHIAENVWPLYPGDVVAPDMADRASATYFKRLRLPVIDTKPPRIETGVSQIRGLLWNPMTKTSSFMILDDGIEKGWNREMIRSFESWTHLKTPMGYNFTKFTDDDFCNQLDPLRYALAPFIEKRESNMGTGAPPMTPRDYAIKELEDKVAQSRMEQQKEVKEVFRETILKEMGISVDLGPPKETAKSDPSKKKLKFAF